MQPASPEATTTKSTASPNDRCQLHSSRVYALLTEDDPNQKYASVKNSYAPKAYGSKTITPSQLKMSIFAKEFLAIYYAFKEF